MKQYVPPTAAERRVRKAGRSAAIHAAAQAPRVRTDATYRAIGVAVRDLDAIRFEVPGTVVYCRAQDVFDLLANGDADLYAPDRTEFGDYLRGGADGHASGTVAGRVLVLWIGDRRCCVPRLELSKHYEARTATTVRAFPGDLSWSTAPEAGAA